VWRELFTRARGGGEIGPVRNANDPIKNSLSSLPLSFPPKHTCVGQKISGVVSFYAFSVRLTNVERGFTEGKVRNGGPASRFLRRGKVACDFFA
jgi:hypothetical protein